MNSLYLLIPIALVLVGLLLWAFWWAIRSGQFDDLDGPAYSILMDDDDDELQPGSQRESAATREHRDR